MSLKNVEVLRAAHESWNKRNFPGVAKNAYHLPRSVYGWSANPNDEPPGSRAVLFHYPNHQAARPGQDDPAYLGEPRSLHPARVFQLAVTGTAVGSDEHVQRE